MNQIRTVAASMLLALAGSSSMAEGFKVPGANVDWPTWQARRLALAAPMPASTFWVGVGTGLRQDGRTGSDAADQWQCQLRQHRNRQAVLAGAVDGVQFFTRPLDMIADRRVAQRNNQADFLV